MTRSFESQAASGRREAGFAGPPAALPGTEVDAIARYARSLAGEP